MSKSKNYSTGLSYAGVLENIAFTFIYTTLYIMATETIFANWTYSKDENK